MFTQYIYIFVSFYMTSCLIQLYAQLLQTQVSGVWPAANSHENDVTVQLQKAAVRNKTTRTTGNSEYHIATDATKARLKIT